MDNRAGWKILPSVVSQLFTLLGFCTGGAGLLLVVLLDQPIDETAALPLQLAGVGLTAIGGLLLFVVLISHLLERWQKKYPDDCIDVD